MHETRIRPAGILRPQRSSTPRGQPGDDAGGFRAPLSVDGRGDLRPLVARMDGVVSAAGIAEPRAGTVPGGRQRASGAGRADGRLVGAPCGDEPGCGPRFDQPVAPGGYAWWYVDALSDDGHHGLTLIAFLGSVFSPYYARARRQGAGDPFNHCALNVALYGRAGKRWALTERGRASLQRTRSSLTIGPSSLTWDGSALTVEIDETTAPLPSRIRGVVRLHPAALSPREFVLDAEGRHRWQPIAPCARVEVALERPALSWSGAGYLDRNAGDAPLENAFASWDWSRASVGRDTAVLYDVVRHGGERMSLACRFDPSGGVHDFAPPPRVSLPRTRWRVARGTRADDGHRATVRQTLEDAPFYARSILSSHLLGHAVQAVHESLSLDRFGRAWVQMLLPFRMPRLARR